jgi:hypothetical protein
MLILRLGAPDRLDEQAPNTAHPRIEETTGIEIVGNLTV